MKLALYVAKWSWASLFIMLWLLAIGWAKDLPLAAVTFVVFAGLTVLSTGLYVYGLYRGRQE